MFQWGGDDKILSPKWGRLIHKLRTEAGKTTTLHVIEGGAHNPAHNRRKDFTEAVSAAIQDHLLLDGDGVAARAEEADVKHVCVACGSRVSLRKGYFSCGCRSWSFNGFVSSSATSKQVDAMTEFLEHLFVHGDFDATSMLQDAVHVRPRGKKPGSDPGHGGSDKVATFFL